MKRDQRKREYQQAVLDTWERLGGLSDAMGEAGKLLLNEIGANALAELEEAFVLEMYEIAFCEPVFEVAIQELDSNGFKSGYRRALGLPERSTTEAVK